MSGTVGDGARSGWRRTWALAVLAAGATAAPAGPAAAATRVVAGDGERCPAASYTSVQAAVDAARSGDTIALCPGVHQEAVTVPAGKDGLRLRGRSAPGATLAAPAGLTGPIVRIAASDVQVTRLRIAGPFAAADGGCPPTPGHGAGVHVAARTAGVEIVGTVIDRITDPAGGQCPASGVDLGRGFVGAAVEVRGKALVARNLIRDYATTGVDVAGAGAFADVRNNTLQAAAPAPGALATTQAGVTLGAGAGADILRNHVSGHRGSPGQRGDGIGIRLRETGAPVSIVNNNADANDTALTLVATNAPVAIINNNVGTDDTALTLVATNAPVAILSNSIFSSDGLGIVAQDTAELLVEGNDVRSGQAGLRLRDPQEPARIVGNGIVSRGTTGIDLVGVRTSLISGNTSVGVVHGIRADGASSGNAFADNDARGSGGTDCVDESWGGPHGPPTFGTCNSWESNLRDESDPAGICTPAR